MEEIGSAAAEVAAFRIERYTINNNKKIVIIQRHFLLYVVICKSYTYLNEIDFIFITTIKIIRTYIIKSICVTHKNFSTKS